MQVAEEIKKPVFKRIRKADEDQENQFPKLLYIVTSGNTKLQVAKTEKKSEKEIEQTDSKTEIGLPPQPTGYLRYSDYDCL